jgi:hypothetical protein
MRELGPLYDRIRCLVALVVEPFSRGWFTNSIPCLKIYRVIKLKMISEMIANFSDRSVCLFILKNKRDQSVLSFF